MASTPKVGDRINYKISRADIDEIIKRRSAAPGGIFSGTSPLDTALADTPAVAIVTAVVPGTPKTDSAPATPDLVNAQVMLDGNDTLFVTSRKAGTALGEWSARSPS